MRLFCSIFSIGLIAAGSAGCAGMQAVELAYTPGGASVGASAGTMPKLFLSSVDDRSGGLRPTGAAIFRPPQLGRPLSEAFKSAVTEELRRLGISLVRGRAESDALLDVTITGVDVGWGQGLRVPVTSTLRYTVRLKSKSGVTFWETDLSGTGTGTAPAATYPGKGPNAAVNAALADAMAKLGTTLKSENLLALAQAKDAQAPPTGAGVSKAELRTLLREALQETPKAGDAPAPVSDVDAPAYRLRERPGDLAVVIGIDRYSDLPPVQFGERDADTFKDHLLALGLPRRNVVHLAGEKAGYKGIEKFVEVWLPKNATEESRVFFYFSGHGAPDPKTGQAYLLPYDGDPNFLENTGYPIERLYEKLGSLKAKRVIVAMDACFSGAGGRSVLAKGARPLVMKVDAATVPRNLTVFAAASADQITSTLEDQGHGTFTYYFLKGLSGAAKDGSGAVTAKGLYDYLKPKVQDAARRQNRDQEPVLRSQVDQELVRF